jgi:hypothetical protein
LTFWTGYPVLAIVFCSIAVIYTLLVCCAVVTALHTKSGARRRAALETLKVLTGRMKADDAP